MDYHAMEDDKSTIELLDESSFCLIHVPEPVPTVRNEIKVISHAKLMPDPQPTFKSEKCIPVPEQESVVKEKKKMLKKSSSKPTKKAQMTSKGGVRNRAPNLSFYARQKLIPLLQDEFAPGNPDNKIPLIRTLNYEKSDADNLVNYIEGQAKQYQQKSELDNNSEPFIRINEWINFLHEKNMNEICGNEFPLLFKLIANMEAHPKPEEIGDIDLKELYTFLSNIMLGYPAKSPTGQTGKFLHTTFKSIIDEMNSPAQDMCDLDEQLKKSTLIAGPDSADNFNLEEIRLILCNSSTNPFNFPFEFLNLNHFDNNVFSHSEGKQ